MERDGVAVVGCGGRGTWRKVAVRGRDHVASVRKDVRKIVRRMFGTGGGFYAVEFIFVIGDLLNCTGSEFLASAVRSAAAVIPAAVAFIVRILTCASSSAMRWASGVSCECGISVPHL